MTEVEKICKNCKWRKKLRTDRNTMYCTNLKLAEDNGQDEEFCLDALIYEYSEGGGFIVGENFGCVHFEKRLT